MALVKGEKIRQEIFGWLAIFSKSELTQLRKFLDSPFFNQTPELVALYEKLSKEFKNGKDGAWRPQKIADQLYPKKKQAEVRFNQLYEHLLKLKDLIRQFVAHLELKDNAAVQRRTTVAALSHRPNHELFAEACNACEDLPDVHLADADAYGQIAWLHRERYSYQTAERFQSQSEHSRLADVYLDRHYLALKLRHIADSLVAGRIFQNRDKTNTLAPPVRQMAMKHYDTDPLIHVYIDIITFLQEDISPAKITRFEDFYLANLERLSEKENQGIIKMIINLYFHSTLNNQHPLPFRIVEWFRVALGEHQQSSRNFFLLNGVLPDDIFLNIATFSATNHAFDFAHDFINRYAALLPDDKREKAKCLARCYVWLHEGKYAEIHQLLKPEEAANPEDYQLRNGKIVNTYEALIRSEFRYAIRARTVLIRMYLMKYLQDWSCGEHFLYAKEAFRKYMDYDALQLDAHRKNSYLNFLTIAGEIYHYLQQHKLSAEVKTKLLDKAQTEQPVVCRQWLLDVIENKMPWPKEK
ncbi:MAG TPA: hypothetical protein PKC76_06340 [Saprospiraceae bacterium]|nr:hypothetical protein [Saprospiraceae bacterium]HMP23730.1 hypothetical protein [Saprospiraceae bacterium]